MKNQWFGDINDFRKFALLNLLCEFYDNMLVAWMLTGDIPKEEKNTGDGRKIAFAKKSRRRYWLEGETEGIQKKIWEKLNGFFYDDNDEIKKDVVRKLSCVKELELLPGSVAQFFDGKTENDSGFNWNARLLCETHEKKADIVFFDADNGIANNIPGANEISCSDEKSRGYIFAEEIIAHIKEERSVLIYQHNTLSKLRNFGQLCKDCKKIISDQCSNINIEKYIMCLKGGSVLFLLIEKDRLKRESIAKRVQKEFTAKFISIL